MFSRKRIKIKASKGSLCFWGDWFGRPYDNLHIIKEVYYRDKVLFITFENDEELEIHNPKDIINEIGHFKICDADIIYWTWYPYGVEKHTESQHKLIYQRLDNGKVKKESEGRSKIFIPTENMAVQLL